MRPCFGLDLYVIYYWEMLDTGPTDGKPEIILERSTI